MPAVIIEDDDTSFVAYAAAAAEAANFAFCFSKIAAEGDEES